MSLPSELDEIHMIQTHSIKTSIYCPIFCTIYLTYIGHHGIYADVNDLNDEYRPSMSLSERQTMKGATDEE